MRVHTASGRMVNASPLLYSCSAGGAPALHATAPTETSPTMIHAFMAWSCCKRRARFLRRVGGCHRGGVMGIPREARRAICARATRCNGDPRCMQPCDGCRCGPDVVGDDNRGDRPPPAEG